MAYITATQQLRLGKLNLHAFFDATPKFYSDINVPYRGTLYEDVFELERGDGSGVIFGGKNFSFSTNFDAISGQVQIIQAYSQNLNTYLSVSDVNIDIVSIQSALMSKSFSDDLAIWRKHLSGKDTMILSNSSDDMRGFSGDDVMDGRGGADKLLGDGGSDTLFGGGGNDKLFGGDGNDSLEGSAGSDLLNGGAGSDLLKGGAGIDKVYGNNGNDKIYGNGGSDFLYAGAGVDKVWGGDGADLLKGGAGSDVLKGGSATDKIYGNGGNDKVWGDGGSDLLYGGEGSDVLFAGRGTDKLWGGSGADNFVFNNTSGSNKVMDFNANNNNEDINLAGVTRITSFADLQADHMTDTGSDVLIKDGHGLQIRLVGVDMSDLHAADFIF